MSQPLPDLGWSQEIVTLRNAWVFPPDEMVGRPQCGVVTAQGADVLHASTWRGGIRMTQAVEAPRQPSAVLSGRHVWGGMYYGHFGHFITETMGRCWAFDQPGIDSILFVPKHDKLGEFQRFQRQFWDLLGLKMSERIQRQPIVVEELLVPGQGFGLGRIARATPAFRETMKRMARTLPQDPPRKIYVSRTKFNGRGGVVCEAIIERNMARCGYTIMHPEKMDLRDQLRFYKSATHIVGVDSSAFHIAGMVADPAMKVALILRRDNKAHESIAAQIGAMLGRDPVIIDALTANWVDDGAKSANHLSWGELDHRRLATDLHEHGFIPDRAQWQEPTDRELTESLAWIGIKHAGGLVRAPLERP